MSSSTSSSSRYVCMKVGGPFIVSYDCFDQSLSVILAVGKDSRF